MAYTTYGSKRRKYGKGKRTYKKRKVSGGRKRQATTNSAIRRMAKQMANFGDYSVKTNSIVGGGMPAAAVVTATENGNIIVRHREYILDVDPTAAFTIAAELPINPGMRITFPWLATIARNFEEYDFKGLVFQFHSTSSDAVLGTAASTSLGTVSMATQYNVLSPPFRSKLEMLNYQFANSSKPSLDLFHPVECRNRDNVLGSLWVRNQNTTLIGADRRMYDQGDFTLTTDGNQGTGGSIGELWCAYEVILKKPKLDSVGSSDAFVFDDASSSPAKPFGDVTLIQAGEFNDLGGTFNAAGTQYILPENTVGQFMVSYFITGDSTAVTNNGLSATNIENLDIYFPLNAERTIPSTGETSTQWAAFKAFKTKPFDGATVITFGASSVWPANHDKLSMQVTRVTDAMKLEPFA